MYVYMHACMYVCIYACIHVCMYVCIWLRLKDQKLLITIQTCFERRQILSHQTNKLQFQRGCLKKLIN